MRKFFYAIALCFSLPAAAQVSFTADGGVDISRHNGQNITGKLGLAHYFSEALLAGATVGLTRLNNRPEDLFLVSAKLLVSPRPEAPLFPHLLLEPGYNFYSEKVTVNERIVETKGGACVFAGGGLALSVGLENKLTFSGGLSLYGFSKQGKFTPSKRISLRTGLIF